MSTKQVWVSPKESGGWRVHNPNNDRDSIHTQTKQEAVNAAKTIAQNQRAELKIQWKDWKIQEANSYWRDPFPPRW